MRVKTNIIMEQVQTEQPQVQELTEEQKAIELLSKKGVVVVIPHERIFELVTKGINELLTDSSRYNNPLKKAVEDSLSYSGALKGYFNQAVETNLKTIVAAPGFQLQVGQAMAEELGKKAVDKLTEVKR